MVETRLRYALRNLRHLYEQMLDGRVTNTSQAALGLLGPAIRMIETEADQQDLTNADAKNVRNHQSQDPS